MNAPDREARLAELVEEFLASDEPATPARRAAFIAEHPEFGEDLAEVLSIVAVVGVGREAELEDEQKAARETRRIGGFRLEHELGRGGMGTVYLATEESLGRRVALKLLPSSASLDDRLVERFRREASATATLEHPHIVPVYGTGSEGQLHYIVMRFVEGPSLDRVLRRLRDSQESDDTATEIADLLRSGRVARTKRDASSTLPTEPSALEREGDDWSYFKNVALLGTQAADALEFAHAHGILHRDVKPGNFLLERSGHLWVTDFGLCVTDESVDLTRSAEVIGTLRYMAPEQVDGEASVASDVFGLGVTLWELTVRQALYEGLGRSALLRSVLGARVPRARSLDRSVPHDLEAIIAKATAPEPNQRYESARAMREDLRAFLEDRPVSARTPGTWDLLRLAYRRNRALAWTAFVALAGILVLSLGYVFSLQASRAEEQRRLYRASIAATVAKLAQRDLEPARAAIADAPVKLRGWEWQHLAARLDRGELEQSKRAGTVTRIALLPESDTLFASFGRTATLFDATGAVSTLLHKVAVLGVALDPRGELRASVDESGDLHLARMGEDVAFTVHDLPCGGFSLAFSSDGEALAVGLRDGRIVLLDRLGRDTGEVLTGGSAPVRQVVFLEHDRVVASCGDDHLVHLHDRDGGDLRTYAGHTTLVHSLDVDPSASRLVSCDDAGLVHVWDLETYATVAEYRHAFPVPAVVFAGSNETVLFSSRDRALFRWEVTSDDPPLEFGVAHLYARSLAWSPARQRVFSGSISGVIESWDPFELAGHAAWRAHAADLHCVRAAPSGDRVLTGGRDAYVALWNGRTGQLERLYDQHDEEIWSFAWSSDARLFATGARDGTVSLSSPESDDLIALWRPPEEERLARAWNASLAFDRANERLFVPRRGFPLRVLRIPDLAELPLEAPLSGVTSVAIGARSGVVFLGFDDGRIEVRGEERLDLRETLSGHERHVSWLTLDPSGELLASTAHDGTCILWDWQRGRVRNVLRVSDRSDVFLSSQVSSASFHPDGSRIAITAQGRAPSLWDVATGQPTITFSEIPRWASTADFLADGTAVACGDSEGMLHVWSTGDLGSPGAWLRGSSSAEAMERHLANRRALSRAGMFADLLALWATRPTDPGVLARARLRAYCLLHRARGNANYRYLYGRSLAERGEWRKALVYLRPLAEHGGAGLRPELRDDARRLIVAAPR